MQITHIEGFSARCEAQGISRDVNLFLLQDSDVAPGDYVLVHVGYAIQKMSTTQAQSTWELIDEMQNLSNTPNRG